MFATPGIAALIILIYMKPQEFIPGLEGLPLLYIMLALATLGLLMDLRLGYAKIDLPPHTPYVIGLYVWCLITSAATGNASKISGQVVDIAIILVVFFLISTGIRSFRAYELVTNSLLWVTLFVAGVCFHQGLAPLGCAVYEGHEAESLRPDNRPCRVADDCYAGDAEPGAMYACEKTGLFGTVSVGGGRVRYRGVLKDPNEIALTCGAAIPILVARLQRKSTILRSMLLPIGIVLIVSTIVFTQSRGGILVFGTVAAVYCVRFLGIKGLGGAVLLALPLLLLGGRSGAEAEESADERTEVLLDGLHMVQNSPVFGVGFHNFTEHSHLTAHNSYMLALAENGFPGLFLYLCVLYVSLKVCVKAILHYRKRPDARIAGVWATGMLASLGGAMVGSFFLSFTYHHVLWIYFGINGALYAIIRRHDPTFEVKLGLKEHGGVGIATIAFAVLLRVMLRLKGH